MSKSIGRNKNHASTSQLIAMRDEIHPDIINIFHRNGIKVGECVRDVDGYRQFWFNRSLSGSCPAHILREIADKLDQINKPWDDQVQQYFKDNPPSPSQETPNP